MDSHHGQHGHSDSSDSSSVDSSSEYTRGGDWRDVLQSVGIVLGIMAAYVVIRMLLR